MSPDEDGVGVREYADLVRYADAAVVDTVRRIADLVDDPKRKAQIALSTSVACALLAGAYLGAPGEIVPGAAAGTWTPSDDKLR